MKALSYSDIKHTPKVPLILLTVEKIKHEYFDFVLLSSFCNNPELSTSLYFPLTSLCHAFMNRTIVFYITVDCSRASLIVV